MDDELKRRARALRRNMTDAERRLWSVIRGRQLAGSKFRRQVVIEPYIVDFACLEKKLVIELDGGQHAERENYDLRRSRFLQRLGYEVLRFWNHEVLEHPDAVQSQILRCLLSSSRISGKQDVDVP